MKCISETLKLIGSNPDLCFDLFFFFSSFNLINPLLLIPHKRKLKYDPNPQSRVAVSHMIQTPCTPLISALQWCEVQELQLSPQSKK